MKEIEEDTNNWKDTPCLCFGQININTSKSPKQSTDSFQSLPKPNRTFYRN